MELQIVETVLRDMLEEQKITSQLNQDLAEKISKLDNKLETFNQKLEQQRVIAPPADVKPIEEMVIHHFNHFREILNNQPKSVIRQVRLLLFPETNSDHYYRIIFGKLLPWGGLFVVVAFLISLGNQYVERSETLQEKQMESNHYQHVFEYLYDKSGKTGKKILQDAWDSSWNYQHQSGK